MAEQTGRDRVWKFAFVKAIRQGEQITPESISELAGVSERMARDCLLVINDIGLLERKVRQDSSVLYESPPGIEFDEEEWNLWMYPDE